MKSGIKDAVIAWVHFDSFCSRVAARWLNITHKNLFKRRGLN